MDQLLRDVRFGARTLLKNRWFSLLAVLTLGLGIGANTAIFSVIDGVLLKPLPYANGNRLLLVREAAPLAGRPNVGVSVAELYDYRAQSRAFDALVEYHQMNFDLLDRGEPDRVSTGVVSHDFFNILGIKPILGRTFVEHDDQLGADAVLVLSYTYWQTKFGGDPHIIGQVFQMNDRPHTVIGILPNVPHYPQENDVYMPVSACPFRAAAERTLAQTGGRRNFTLTVFGRLKPEVTPEQATKDVDVICSRFAHDDPTTYRPGSGFTVSTLAVRDALTSQARPMLLILLATTGLVLIIACANVANLTLARLLRRDRELAVRTALGAGRAQLVRQLLTESLLLSLAGGVVGLAFASSTMKMLTTFVGRFTARTGEIGIDPWVLGFTLFVSIVTGIAFGTFPALSSRVDLVNIMKQGARGGTSTSKRRMQNGLIVAQVSVSVLLLVGAGLLLASFVRLQRVDPGYRGDHVLSAQAFPNFSRYPNAGDHLRFYEPVLERLKAEPGVISVAVTDAVPLGAGNPFNIPFTIAGRSENQDRRPNTDLRTVSPDYFRTLDIPLVAGRVFTDSDRRDGPPVVIVNQAMLRYFDGKDPVGSRIFVGNPPPNADPTWATIVGVVGDVRQFGLERASVAQVYQPLSQTGGLAGRFLVRTQSDPLAAAKMLRDDVHAVDPAMPVVNVRTLDDLRERYLATPKVTAMLLTIFAALALLVTMAGLTGVIAASVTQRTHEFGVRMALGASRDLVMRVVIGQGLALVGIGLVIGIGAATALTRVLSSYLFDTQPTDPITLGAVVGALVVSGAIACAGPAWRATTVDPMEALRAD